MASTVCRKDAACQRPHEDPEDSAGEEEGRRGGRRWIRIRPDGLPRDQMLPDPISFEATIPVAEKEEVLLPRVRRARGHQGELGQDD